MYVYILLLCCIVLLLSFLLGWHRPLGRVSRRPSARELKDVAFEDVVFDTTTTTTTTNNLNHIDININIITIINSNSSSAT